MKDKDCGRDSETGYKEAFRLRCSLRFFLSYAGKMEERLVKMLEWEMFKMTFLI